MDGAPSSMKSNQAVVELTDTSELPTFLKKYDAKVVSQSIIPAKAKWVNYTDGSQRLETEGEAKPLPTYVVSFNNLDAVNESVLPELGVKVGLKGEYHFNTSTGAKLFTKVFTIHDEHDPSIKHIGFNYICRPDVIAFTAEGSSTGSSPYPTAPNNNQLWFAGPSSYGFYYGNNINSASTSVNSLHELSSGSNTMGVNINVAIIDNGFTWSGEGMNSSIFGNASTYYTYNFIGSNSNIDGANTLGGDSWHGRACASMIYSPLNDNKGTMGTASRATPFVFKTDFTAAMNQTAIDTSRSWGAKVLSMSWSTTSGAFNPMESALDNNAKANMINFSSTGNSGSASATYPAWWSNTIGISAHGKNNALAVYSSGTANTQGASLYAAGEDIQCAAVPTGAGVYNYSKYRSLGGTSLACPIVAGVAAILVQQGKASNNATVDSRLYNYGYTTYSAGRSLNALNAAL